MASAIRDFDIVSFFRNLLAQNDDLSPPVASICALLEVIKFSSATTTFELLDSVRNASVALKNSSPNPVSITAGCDLFIRFINSSTVGTTDVESIKAELIRRGHQLIAKARTCREQCVAQGLPFIRDDAVILVHSYSRVVTLLLQRAAQAKKRFRVYVTESRPSDNGIKAADVINKLGMNIPVTVIIDTAVAYFMDKVDLVLVGAEGVVENGGLINHVGTYQVGIIAKAANKPLYAVAESFKFVRLYPLNQRDFKHSPENIQYRIVDGKPERPGNPQGNEKSDPSVDYTPPQFISLLFTDLGVLTPSGVGDSLITMWND